MSDRSAPWFRFFPADFMNGVRGMTATEVGLYQMLLCRIYEENGPVEYHPLRLSTYCGMREATFEKTFEKLVALGKLTVTDGMVTNARAEIEISNRAHDLKNASRAGKASAEKRQQKQRRDATPVQQPFSHTDTDTDTDKDKEEGETYVSPPVADDTAAAVEVYNDAARRCGWAKVQRMNRPRFSALKARLAEVGGLDGWRIAMQRAEASDFLCGRRPGRDGPFFASFDFLTQPSSFTRLMEGNYDNRTSQQHRGQPASDLPENRPDPALANIARIVGIRPASGDGCS